MGISRVRYAVLATAAAASVGLMAGRAVAAPDDWAVDADGLWTLPANWTAGLPVATSDVTINRPAGDFLVTLNSGAQSINSLVTAERLTISAGTLTVATTMNVQNIFTLSGGVLAKAVLSTSGAGSLVMGGGTLDQVTLASNLTLSNGQTAAIRNGLTLSGVLLNLTSTAGYSSITTTGSQTLGGTGTVTLDASSGYYAQLGAGGAGTLTIAPGIVVKTGVGTSATIGYVNPTGLVNQGLISSQTSGKELQIGGTTWTNSGVMEAKTGGILSLGGAWSNTGTLTATAGTLNLGGTFTTAGLGTLAAGGGTVRVTGALNNAGATLGLTAATGSVVMQGGTITNGTVVATGGAQLQGSTSGGTLDGVTLGTDLSLLNGQGLTIKNGLTLLGSAVNVTSTAGYSSITSTGSQTLGGTGTVTLDASNGYYAQLGTGGAGTLTIAPGIVVKTGAGTSATMAYVNPTALVNQGLISSQTSAKELQINSATWTNSGVLEAKSGGILTLGGVWSNTGTLTMNAGTLNLGGTLTTGGLGTLTRTGGAVRISGLLDNTGSTLALTAATGSYILQGGTIKNGTLTATGGAELQGSTSGGTLDGVTLGTDLSLSNGQGLTIKNGMTLLGSAVNILSSAGYSSVTTTGSQTLGGTGTVTLDASNGYYAQFGASGAGTLTIAPGIVVKTGAGTSATMAYVNPDALINQGLISSQTSGRELQISSPIWTNSGVLEAKTGGILTLAGVWSNTGTLTMNAGTLNLGGTLTTGGLGTLTRTGGAVRVTGLLDNTGSTLALTAATGSFIMQGGTIKNGLISASGGAQLQGSTSSGILDGVTLGTDLTLLNGQILTIKSGLTLVNTVVSLSSVAGYSSITTTGSQTLGGTGTVTLDASNGYYAQFGASGAGTLTIAPGIVVKTGAGTSATMAYVNPDGLINQGLISSQTSGRELQISSPIWTNSGVLEAKTGGILTLAGVWSNTGTLTMNAGTLNLGGTLTTGGLGTLTRTGGEVRVTGLLINTGATLGLTATTGSFIMQGGTIRNGTITSTGGALLQGSTSSGTLDGVTLATDLTLNNGQILTLINGLTLTGTAINLTSVSGYSSITTTGSQTLGGTGTVTLAASNGYYAQFGASGTGTLTIAPGILVTTGAGTSAAMAYLNPTGLINQGVIRTNTAGITLGIGGTLLNSGTITGPGNVNFAGTSVTLGGLYNVGGTLTSTSGPLVFNGAAQSAGLITGASDITVNSTTGLTSDGVRGNSLTVNTVHTIRSNGSTNGTSRVTALTLAGGLGAWSAKLELNNTLMIVQANTSNKAAYLTAIRDQVVAGAGGSVGITSASALSDPVHKKTYVVDNGILGLTGWNGFSVNSTSILVGATYLGDANFDRVVNVTDLGVLATFYGQAVPNGLLQGDFNGDGVVNVTDLGALATNYGSGTGGGVFSLEADLAQFPVFGAASGVPEPASVAVLGAAALLLVKRRRGLRLR